MTDPDDAAEAEATDAAVALDFDPDGLVPVIAQDIASGTVLMLAYATPTAIARTHDTGVAHYYSRSREELWEKGATSGHRQHVAEIRVDCDADAVLYRVEQTGGACHTGFASCFHRVVTDVDGPTAAADADAAADTDADDDLTVALRRADDATEVFDPDAVYG